ncbi:hypothetical protein [Burkholderia glumae]|uniref:hypothetical protein n=1 Tax=Burkholderia glumae TaxID=337 RepID=UPI0012FC2A9B|nr:hypothetical protein [Burkholderia glumae]
MRYNRVLAYHPIAAAIPDFYRQKMMPRRRRFPAAVPQDLWSVANNAIFDLVFWEAGAESQGLHRPLMSDREAFRRFFEFRQKVLEYSREFLNSNHRTGRECCLGEWLVEPGSLHYDMDLIRFEALNNIILAEQQGGIHMHLDVLREIWFLPGICISDDDPLSFSIPTAERGRFLACHYAAVALMKCDEAVLARRGGRYDAAMAAAIVAAQAAKSAFEFNGSITRIVIDAVAQKEMRSRFAKVAARKGHRRRPIYKVKRAVYELWLRWQRGEIKFKNNSKFALHVVNAFEELESTGSVEKWQREWRQGKAIPEVC